MSRLAARVGVQIVQIAAGFDRAFPTPTGCTRLKRKPLFTPEPEVSHSTLRIPSLLISRREMQPGRVEKRNDMICSIIDHTYRQIDLINLFAHH